VRATFVIVIIELSFQTFAFCQFILIDSLILLAYLSYGDLLHYSVRVFSVTDLLKKMWGTLSKPKSLEDAGRFFFIICICNRDILYFTFRICNAVKSAQLLSMLNIMQ